MNQFSIQGLPFHSPYWIYGCNWWANFCTIILACKMMKMDYIMGVNPFAEVDNNNPLTNDHYDGEDKWFPMGPSCIVNGMKVPCFICNSDNGRIASKLLHSILKQHIDNCHIFDRTDGVLPFFILDGHGCRFELPFLEYINNIGEDGHKWYVCIGVPYGTSVWQVGDSAEQNGSFKMAMVWAKVKLLKKKADCHLDFTVEKKPVLSYLFIKPWEILSQYRQQIRKQLQREVGDLSTTYC